MPTIGSSTDRLRTTLGYVAAILLFLVQVLTPLQLGGLSVAREVGSPQVDTVSPPPRAEYYILTPVVADGMSTELRKDLTRTFFEEASTQLADRINERDADYSAVRDCGSNTNCEVVSIQIRQGAGDFAYEIKSRIISGPGPARHPDIAAPRTCSINTGEAGSEPLRECHRKFLLWYADKLVSHDKAYHGVDQ